MHQPKKEKENIKKKKNALREETQYQNLQYKEAFYIDQRSNTDHATLGPRIQPRTKLMKIMKTMISKLVAENQKIEKVHEKEICDPPVRQWGLRLQCNWALAQKQDASGQETQHCEEAVCPPLLDSTSSFTATLKIPITNPTQEMNQRPAYSRRAITNLQYQSSSIISAQMFNHKILIQWKICFKIPSTSPIVLIFLIRNNSWKKI